MGKKRGLSPAYTLNGCAYAAAEALKVDGAAALEPGEVLVLGGGDAAVDVLARVDGVDAGVMAKVVSIVRMAVLVEQRIGDLTGVDFPGLGDLAKRLAAGRRPDAESLAREWVALATATQMAEGAVQAKLDRLNRQHEALRSVLHALQRPVDEVRREGRRA